MKTSHLLSSVLCTLSFCALLSCFTGCKGKQPEPLDPTDPKNQAIAGNVSKPEWTAPAEYDMGASMTAVVKVDLSVNYAAQLDTCAYQLASGDLLAAFAGDECLGVDTLHEDLFFLYVCAPTSEDTNVTLRYYSATLRNIFVAENVFKFVNDDNKGTASDPFTPSFLVEKK